MAGATATKSTSADWFDAELRDRGARLARRTACRHWASARSTSPRSAFMRRPPCAAGSRGRSQAGRPPDAAQASRPGAPTSSPRSTRPRPGAPRSRPMCRREEEAGDRRRRPLRDRHRAAREPAHRQPAAWPLRPPGRPRPLQVLPVARRRPDAHLRLGPHGRRAAEAGPAGRRGHHASLDQQGAGEGAAEGRGAQLRLAQVRAQVRRRDERPAQGHLRAAHRHHGPRRRQRDRRRHAHAGRERAGGAVHPAQRLRRAVGHRHARRARWSASSTSTCRSTDWAAEEGIADQEITERLLKQIEDKAKQKEAEFGPEAMRQIEKMVLLQTLDHLWREHLVVLEHLRSVIGFRSYGQRDPLNEYKTEGFQLFETMLVNLREAVTGQLMHMQSDAGRAARTCSSRSSCRRCRRITPIRSRARTSWPWPTLRLPAGERSDDARRRAPRAAADAPGRDQPRTRRTPPPGARSRATRSARAARARNTSIATASTTDGCRQVQRRQLRERQSRHTMRDCAACHVGSRYRLCELDIALGRWSLIVDVANPACGAASMPSRLELNIAVLVP